jgi:hypothetical protein
MMNPIFKRNLGFVTAILQLIIMLGALWTAKWGCKIPLEKPCALARGL